MRGQIVKNQTQQLLIHAIAISALVLVALFLATRYGLISCDQVPYWCSGYHMILEKIYGRTYPNILILYGKSGMGDPHALANFITNNCNLYAQTMPISMVGPGNLSSYDVLIVEHARTLTPEEMAAIWDFAARGGKVLIAGDVGVDAEKNSQYLRVPDNTTWSEMDHVDANSETNSGGHLVIMNRWDRVDAFGNPILFGTQFLGLKYVGDYCHGEANCDVMGYLVPIDDELTSGLHVRVPFNHDFVVVQPLQTSIFGQQKIFATIGGVGACCGQSPPYPVAIRDGYRVVYYAFPPDIVLKDVNATGDSQTRYALVRLLYDICRWAAT
ncbi:MAG: hypothetical protein GXN93_04545 [Candidatus Diapherotrites archaeon]|nr:hypothetical protein [Candidatus Diapherotrites archaeon]